MGWVRPSHLPGGVEGPLGVVSGLKGDTGWGEPGRTPARVGQEAVHWSRRASVPGTRLEARALSLPAAWVRGCAEPAHRLFRARQPPVPSKHKRLLSAFRVLWQVTKVTKLLIVQKLFFSQSY